MNDTTQDPPESPEDLLSENDEEQVLSPDALPSGVEHLGDGFTDLDDYFRAELAEYIAPPIHWILEHLDMKAIRGRFEADFYRYLCESGSVYRFSLSERRR